MFFLVDIFSPDSTKQQKKKSIFTCALAYSAKYVVFSIFFIIIYLITYFRIKQRVSINSNVISVREIYTTLKTTTKVSSFKYNTISPQITNVVTYQYMIEYKYNGIIYTYIMDNNKKYNIGDVIPIRINKNNPRTVLLSSDGLDIVYIIISVVTFSSIIMSILYIIGLFFEYGRRYICYSGIYSSFSKKN